MAFINLNNIAITELPRHFLQHHTIVACLCAAWCDACTAYYSNFTALAEQYPDLLFLWIDVEDQAAFIGDFDVENFPTLLIQQQEVVTFYGAMLPDTTQLTYVIQSQTTQTLEQLRLCANTGHQSRLWQTQANLRARLDQYTHS